MRKSTVFILAAAVLSAAFICLACREINALSSAVSYESTAVIGDSRAADGLTVGLSASSGNMLCWDTRFRPDGDPETDFRFDQVSPAAPSGMMITDYTYTSHATSAWAAISI